MLGELDPLEAETTCVNLHLPGLGTMVIEIVVPHKEPNKPQEVSAIPLQQLLGSNLVNAGPEQLALLSCLCIFSCSIPLGLEGLLEVSLNYSSGHGHLASQLLWEP